MNEEPNPTTPVAVTMRYLNCWTCGILFAVQEAVFKHRDEHDEEIYCPNGHAELYTTRREAERQEPSCTPSFWHQAQTRLERLGLASQPEAKDMADASNKSEVAKPRDGKPRCPKCGKQYRRWDGWLNRHMCVEHGMNEDTARAAILEYTTALFRDGIL